MPRPNVPTSPSTTSLGFHFRSRSVDKRSEQETSPKTSTKTPLTRDKRSATITNAEPLQSASSMLEERIIKVWSAPLSNTPVFKDLPRLAGRITVSGQFGKFPSAVDSTPALTVPRSPKPTVEKLTVREFITEYIMGNTKDLIEANRYITTLEANTFVWVDSALFTISDERWVDYGIPKELIDSLKKAAAEEEEKSKLRPDPLLRRTVSTFSFSRSSVTLLDKLESVEEEDNSGDSTALSSIIDANEKAEDVSEEIITSEATVEPTIEHGVLMEVSRVITELAGRLETSERQALIRKQLKKIMARKGIADMGLVMEELFQTIGSDTPMARLLKSITQNIIFAGVYTLKMKVPSMPMTRDVRTREGWTVSILFTQNIVTVVHRRREQSLATPQPNDGYWFGWELRMVFDREATRLESCSLRITELYFEENIQPQKRESVAKALSYGREEAGITRDEGKTRVVAVSAAVPHCRLPEDLLKMGTRDIKSYRSRQRGGCCPTCQFGLGTDRHTSSLSMSSSPPANTSKQKKDDAEWITSEEPDKKRKRRRKAEISRSHVCYAAGCDKSYGSDGALRVHMKIKHPGLEVPSKSSKPSVTLDQTPINQKEETRQEATSSIEQLQRSKVVPDQVIVPALMCQVGGWKIESSDANIFFTFDFSQKRFLWETARFGQTHRVIIPFSTIIGLLFHIIGDGASLLTIEVSQPSQAVTLSIEGTSSNEDFTGGHLQAMRYQTFQYERFTLAAPISRLFHDFPDIARIAGQGLTGRNQGESQGVPIFGQVVDSFVNSDVVVGDFIENESSREVDVSQMYQNLSPCATQAFQFTVTPADVLKDLAGKDFCFACCKKIVPFPSLLQEVRCECDIPYYYSFCWTEVLNMDGFWHCQECKSCKQKREWHCYQCNRCTFGLSMPCQHCQSPLDPNITQPPYLFGESAGWRVKSKSHKFKEVLVLKCTETGDFIVNYNEDMKDT
ncbi:hypothetical protein PROFUN_03266 [Planoprotostelium fungivorum]|uniref:C2H2-type domain-containing protein n=1 Tax=Planoprotostelium fungivorum TaxID=1890364 RepID=A0A2P6NWK9_9EUKA|nr:hypothetical protein PROFUN_03266 [Planoprotostelium fungivorum]